MVMWRENEAAPPVTTKVGWKHITRKEYFFTDETLHEFDLFGRPEDEGVAIIGLTTDHKVIVAEQYRPGPALSMDELPGGFMEKGESPEEAARREFREETGYEAGRMELLGTAHHDGYPMAKHHYFLAYDCQKAGEPIPEDHEWIEVKEMPIPDFIASAKNGRVIDAAAVLMAHDTLMSLTR